MFTWPLVLNLKEEHVFYISYLLIILELDHRTWIGVVELSHSSLSIPSILKGPLSRMCFWEHSEILCSRAFRGKLCSRAHIWLVLELADCFVWVHKHSHSLLFVELSEEWMCVLAVNFKPCKRLCLNLDHSHKELMWVLYFTHFCSHF